jgi:hypothetical protein
MTKCSSFFWLASQKKVFNVLPSIFSVPVNFFSKNLKIRREEKVKGMLQNFKK